MKAIQIISQDLFDKVRSRFQNLEMGDETGAVTIDPAEARFFDFDFVHEGVNLGRVSISLNDLGSLKIYYSQGITENQDDPSKKLWYSFLKEMRLFAMRRLLRFDTRDIAKSNLDRNDFQHLAATQAPKDDTMNVNESRWTQKSSKKTSRAVKGATEVIVRHHKPVDEMFPGSRSQRKNIKAIFIQNKDGERFKYPFIHPAGAFAMAQHVDHGGTPHDPAGKAIMRMSEQIAQLQEFQKQVQHTQLHDDALGITERAVGRLQELKACVERLSKRHHYEAWVGEFNGEDEPLMADLDPVTMETYKQAFTQSSFNENLASLFPLIHSIMQETNKVDLEAYVSEDDTEKKYTVHCSQCGGEFKRDKNEGYSHCKDHSTNEDAFNEFVEWAEAVEQGRLTDDQINDLKNALAELPNGQLELGPDGQTAWQFFSGFGLEDSDLENKLKSAAELDPATDPMEVLQVWAKDHYPELLVALGMSGQPTETPLAPEAGAAPEQQPAPVAEGSDPKAMIQEVAKIVKSFYNRDNPEVGPFRGGEGIALDVEKQIGEKFGEEAGQQARALAEKFMQKLTLEWESRHGRPAGNVDDSDGLARLKELLGNVKAKVESINGPKKSDIPAYMRKEKGGDWKTSTQDLEKEKERNISGPEGLKALKARLGQVEGSGPKEKQKTPYRDINSSEYRKAADAQKAKMAADKKAEPGKELAKKIDQKTTNESEITSIIKLAGLAK
jgi:hypothetical protein